MKLVRLAFKREMAVPMLAVVFASAVSFALVLARIVWTGRLSYKFLGWNLFLAWLPLIFALLACDEYRGDGKPNWRFRTLVGAWLVFFPNAPYICTDLIHLATRYYAHFWVDLMPVLLCALTGLVLGFLSLYLMQGVVMRMLGRAASWAFIAIVAGLSGFGVYVGRFLRFNSWDIVLKPVELVRGIGNLAVDPLAHPTSIVFPVLFATFLFIAYVMLYALTHLQPAPLAAVARNADS